MGKVIYIFVGLFSLFCAFFEFWFKNYNKRLTFHRQLYFFLSLFLILFAGTRADTGLDFGNYQSIYYRIHSGGSFLECQVEPLYWFVNLISPSEKIMFLLFASISCIPILHIFYKYCTNKFLCLFLFYCTCYVYFDMGIIREGAAISVIIWGLKYAHDRKYIRFFISILIAEMFHLTAFAALPILLIGEKRKKISFYLCLTVFFVVISSALPSILIKLIGRFSGVFALAAYKFNAYTTYLFSESNIIGAKIYRSGLMLLFIYLYTRYISRTTTKSVKSCNTIEYSWVYMNAYFVSTLEFLILSSIPYFSTRFSAILYYSFFFIYNALISKKVNKWIRLFMLFLALVTSFRALMNTIYNSTGNMYIPYTSWLLKI